MAKGLGGQGNIPVPAVRMEPVKAQPVIELERVTKIYPLPAGDVVALDRVDLVIHEGEFVVIMGPSGSGKTTLLNLIGCLDRPTGGDLRICGRSVRSMPDRELTDLRLNRLGFVFQRYNLIPVLTAFENVEFPYLMKHRTQDSSGHVQRVLASTGIAGELAGRTPRELSGGQQQRVAIARALVNGPSILLCDEPTGNLDSRSGEQVMELLSGLNREGKTIVLVTHEQEIAQRASRIVRLRDGRIE